MMTLISSISLIFVAFICVSNTESIEIKTKLGKIIGNVIYNNDNLESKVYEFLGIQYGIPPIGNLRFRPSILNDSWSNSSYNASTYGKMCIQANKSPDVMSEDCLNLNIWTPNIQSSACLPVMFWIHGGGLKEGSGTYPKYNGTKFIDIAQNIIVVTIDYRLGPLGFLSSIQLYNEDPINYPSTGGLNGIGDQITALMWVKQFISDFGGDPNKITIFGESAGGNSVCMLSISNHPNITKYNLFSKAISESCSCTGPWAPWNESDGLLVCQQLLIQNNLPTNITELRELAATDFALKGWIHSVDGFILKQEPLILYSNISNNRNMFHPDKLIMGFNSMDGTSEQKPYPKNEQEYNEYISKYITNKTQLNLIETYYYPLSDYESFDNYPDSAIAWFTMNGDVCVSCPTFYQMDIINNQLINDDKYSGYLYEFRGTTSPYYAAHGADVPFVFDYPDGVTKFHINWNQNLSNCMISGWSNFGKNGIPNITNLNDFQWKPFDINNKNVIIFDDNIRIETNYLSTFRKGACLFWYNQVGIQTINQLCNQGSAKSI